MHSLYHHILFRKLDRRRPAFNIVELSVAASTAESPPSAPDFPSAQRASRLTRPKRPSSQLFLLGTPQRRRDRVTLTCYETHIRHFPAFRFGFDKVCGGCLLCV